MAVEQAPQHLPHHLPTPGEMLEWIGHHKTRLTMAAIALGGAGYLMVAHDRGSQNPAVTVNNPISDTFKPADPGTGSEVVIPATSTETPTPTATASASPEPPPTQEPTKVPSTPTTEPTKAPATPEAKNDVPCNILPQEYCSQAKVIDWTNPSGKKMKVIGFNLPAGVPLSIPIDGQVAKVQLPVESITKGFQAQVFDPNNPNPVWYVFNGDLQFDNMLSLNMKKGEVFGRTQNTGIENAGGHNLVFYIIRGSGREATIAEDELEKMLPEAFKKPTVKASAPQGSGGVTITTKTFFDNPPK